ncbi:MAG: hypothetical protein EXR77_20445 [Myxococcales bacterium]|nr:hypothetical protein [Myxococcales bacterium]
MVTEVDGERLVKVLDFGIAHVADSSLTGTGRALGTPAYMSPQQCSGATLDARSDLYAVAIALAALPLRDRGEAARAPAAVPQAGAVLVVPVVVTPLPVVEPVAVPPAPVAVQQLAQPPTPTAQVEVPVLVQPTTAPAAESLQAKANEPKVAAAVPKAKAPSKKRAMDASLPQ